MNKYKFVALNITGDKYTSIGLATHANSGDDVAEYADENVAESVFLEILRQFPDLRILGNHSRTVAKHKRRRE